MWFSISNKGKESIHIDELTAAAMSI
jgi:hypothetical protein